MWGPSNCFMFEQQTWAALTRKSEVKKLDFTVPIFLSVYHISLLSEAPSTRMSSEDKLKGDITPGL